MITKIFKLLLPVLIICITTASFSQFRAKEINWSSDGNAYLKVKDGGIVKTDVKTNTETILIKKEQVIPEGRTSPIKFNIYNFSADNSKLLIYTNTAKVWRYNTRGDY